MSSRKHFKTKFFDSKAKFDAFRKVIAKFWTEVNSLRRTKKFRIRWLHRNHSPEIQKRSMLRTGFHFLRRYCNYKKMTDDEQRDLFIMMMQGNAADFINGVCEGATRTPSYYTLKKAFEENYLKAKELRWQNASALWHEKQGATEKVTDYLIRMKKLARNLEIFARSFANGNSSGVSTEYTQAGNSKRHEQFQ
jgi:hypothetical protein